ncbi:hypothetical protein HAX54_009968 [Datura stramonium]|uniref:Uncharacterized protein n=1 Tax=Datura stramonium TaxID=4076 RepID=A0ABS8TGI0_DATST|nr:hypothetical protein [Datura stramonium]
MSQLQSPTKSPGNFVQETPLNSSRTSLFPPTTDFQIPFSKTPTHLSFPLMTDMLVRALYIDYIDKMSIPSSLVDEARFDSSVGLKEKIPTENPIVDILHQPLETGPLECATITLEGMKPIESIQGLGTSSSSSHEKDIVSKNIMFESSIDHLFERDFHEERGKSSSILAMGDRLIVSQSIISYLNSTQEKSYAKVQKLTRLFAQKDAEIACLMAALQQIATVPIEEPSPMAAFCQKNEELKLKLGSLTQKILLMRE